MAFRTQKISQMTPKGANLEATDLIEVSTIESGSYVTRSITGQEIIDAAVGNVDWGDIGGTLSAQTDLQTALNAKQNTLSLTTTGSSGASTLVGATLNVPNYTLLGLGGVPTSRTLTINGVTQDLSADRTFTISTGITIGSTAITSGVVGRVLFEGAGNVVQESSSLFWDATNNRLGIGTSTPAYALEVKKSVVGDHGTNIQNTSNSTSARSFFQVSNDTNQYAEFLLNSSTYTGSARFGITGQAAFMDANVITILGTIGANALIFGTNNIERVRVFGSTGNIGINTTTDAGFRLDVNGTARATSFTASPALVSAWANSVVFARFGHTSFNGSTSFGFMQSNAGDCYVNGPNVYLSGGTTVRLEANGSERMRVFSTGNVGINTTTDVASSLLTLESTTKGFLPPRMTTTQKNAIATPAAGLMVYDTTLNVISYYNGTMWI